jgi:hypothetical protein
MFTLDEPRRRPAPQTRARRSARWLVCALFVAFGGVALAASSTAATDYTFTGAGGAWSTGSNWAGGVAPVSPAGTLSLPASSCSSTACPSTTDDISGLSASTLSIQEPSVTSGSPPTGWYLEGTDSLTLTSGLIDSLTQQTGPLSFDATRIGLPISLGAANTWTVDGSAVVLGDGGVSGNQSLAINLAHGGSVDFNGASNEVGALTINGSGTQEFVTVESDLNGTNGHAVALNGAALSGSSTPGATAAIGALATSNGASVSPASNGTSAFLSAASAAFDPSSSADFTITGSGTTAGTDYDQLISTGAINLAGAQLSISDGVGGGSECPTPLNGGNVYTLVSATGTLSGTFANAPDGALIADACNSSTSYRINYHESGSPQTVTATVTGTPPPTHNLSVSLVGGGSGSLASTPAGISCPGTCSHDYTTGTVVTLTATPDSGWTFAGWSGGGCSGTGTCQVTMSSDQTVTATFTGPTLGVSLAGLGSGTVTSSPAGISCPAGACSHEYAAGTVVTLTAAAASGSTFTGWSGAGCSGTATCQVAMNTDQTVTATFTTVSHTLVVSLAGDGSGTVTGSGIACQGTCSRSYPAGTTVTLIATPGSGSAFTSWSGAGSSGADCRAARTRTVAMDSDQTVTATFGASADLTWCGIQGGSWSSGDNWVGGSVPSGTVGTLVFPATSCTSQVNGSGGLCTGSDDVSGLTASRLDLVSPTSPPAPAAEGWLISGGNALTLTSGLSTALQSTAAGASYLGVDLGIPIHLGAPNTWTIGGFQTNFAGDLSGAPQPLTINLSDLGIVGLEGASNEVGPVTINGPSNTGSPQFDGVMLGNPTNTGDLNGTDGQPVTVNSSGLSGAGAIGPLTTNGGALTAGRFQCHPSCSPGALAVHGAMSLHGGSVAFPDLKPGGGSPVAGSDYPQITTTGAAALGGVPLSLGADCNQPPGTTYTLLSAGGGLSGTFDLADGAIVHASAANDSSCSAAGATPPYLQIHYTAHTVTATVVLPPTVTTGTVFQTGQGERLNGSVDPHGLALSDCHFDWGTTTAYGSTAPCAQTVGAGSSTVSVSAEIDNSALSNGTVYHYRLVATDVGGTGTGADATFTAGYVPQPCPPGPSGAPNICSVDPDNGPVLGGTDLLAHGSGFQPGDKLCFYESALVHAPVACIAKPQVTGSTYLEGNTPNLGNSAAVGQYYLGIERCCSYDPSANTYVTSDYVSNTTYLYFPPPPLSPPSSGSCQVFSVGPDACWRVGAGAVASWFLSAIESNFRPGRNPDWLSLSGLTSQDLEGLGGGDGTDAPIGASLGPVWTVACSGDLWTGPAGSLGVGPSGVSSIVVTSGYTGYPADKSRTWSQVDNFVSGPTIDVNAAAVSGIGFITSPLDGTTPNWGIEYSEGVQLGANAAGGYSFFVSGPDMYTNPSFNLVAQNPSLSPNQVDPALGDARRCTSVTSATAWLMLVQLISGAVTSGGPNIPIQLPCAAPDPCNVSLSLATGGTAGAAAARKRLAGTSEMLGRGTASIPGRSVGKVSIHLTSAGKRLIARAKGRLRSVLAITETIGGRTIHTERSMTLEPPPEIAGFKEQRSKWTETARHHTRYGVGTTFSFMLNEGAAVVFIFRKRGAGHSMGRDGFVINGHPGLNVIHFRGAIPGHGKLDPGRYAVTLMAIDMANARSTARRLRFTIVN